MGKHKLIVVAGAPASGKTRLAQRLAKETGYQRVSMDELKEAFFDVAGYYDRAWSKRIGKLAWPVFQKLVEGHLEKEESVIAEATFLWASDGPWLSHLHKTYDVELIQLWMTAHPEALRSRFIERANTIRHPGHNDALEEVIDEFDERFFSGLTYIPHPIGDRTKIIDTTDFDEFDFGEVLAFINPDK